MRSGIPVAGKKSISARKAWITRRSARYKASRSERASKASLKEWCGEHGWKLIFFEGKSGAPRTGIVDALIARIRPRECDCVEIRLVQLKSGSGGLTAREIARLKSAVSSIDSKWLLAAFDGKELHMSASAH